MSKPKHRSRKRRMRIIKSIWNTVTWILMGLAVLTAFALVGVRLIGLRPYAVLSGSMEPTYKTGAIVYVKKVDYRDLTVGDPITFMLNEEAVATHRIVEVIPDEEEPGTIRYRTKGDNNEDVDGGLVHCRNIIGKPIFTIPYLGYAANYIQHPPGTYIVVAACAILLLLAFLPDLFDEDDGKKKQTGKKVDKTERFVIENSNSERKTP